jgi:hypothetical protein
MSNRGVFNVDDRVLREQHEARTGNANRRKQP